MTRLGVSFIDIATAAEELQAQGIEPTIEKIRHLLGTGSNSTIGKYLHEWRLHGSAVHAAITKTSTPDPLKLAVDKVWQQVSEQAQQEIARVKEELLAKLALAEDAYQTVCKKCDQLQAVHAETSQRERDLFAEKEMLAIEFRGLKDENLQWQDRCRGLEEINKQQKLHQEVELKNLVETHGSEMARLEGLLQEFYSRQDQLLHEIKQQYQAEKQELIQQQQCLRDDLMLEQKWRSEFSDKMLALHTELQFKETALLTILQEMKVELLTSVAKSSDQYDHVLNLSVNVLKHTDAFGKGIEVDFTKWNAVMKEIQNTMCSGLDELTTVAETLVKMTETVRLEQPAKAS